MATEVDRLDGRLQGPVWREREGRGRRGVGLLSAGLLVLLVAGGAAAWFAWRAGGEGEVPMILADDSPLRVRPAEPGGYRVPNQDIEAYPGARQRQGERRIEVLLPPPEEPKALPRPTQAAPAQAAAPPSPSPPALAPSSLTASSTASSPAQSSAHPAAAPASPPAAVAPARPGEPPRPAQASPPSGPVSVQLAAVTAESQVQPEIARLRARLAQELGARQLTASRIDRDGRPLWRIRAGGFPDEASARAFCETVRAKGMGCLVVSGS